MKGDDFGLYPLGYLGKIVFIINKQKDILLDYLIYLIYRFFEFLFHIIPKILLKPILHFIAYVAHLFAKKHNRIAKANLDLAFGETKTEEEKIRIIKSSLRNMVYNLYEFIVLQKTSLEKMDQKVIIENEEVILKLIEEKKRIIIITGHYGCWEFSIPYVAMKYNPLTLISRKLNNRYINDVFTKARHRQSLEMCEKTGAAKCIVKAIKKGRIVAITIDQNLDRRNSAIDVSFFGHKVTQVDSPVRLATKLDAVILPLFTIREDFEKYKILFKEPIEIKQNMNEEEIKNLSQELSFILEEQVREKPDDWFWQHRRWKMYYPEIYK